MAAAVRDGRTASVCVEQSTGKAPDIAVTLRSAASGRRLAQWRHGRVVAGNPRRIDECRAVAECVAAWARGAILGMEGAGHIRFRQSRISRTVPPAVAPPLDVRGFARRCLGVCVGDAAVRAAIVARAVPGIVIRWQDGALETLTTLSTAHDALIAPLIRPLAEDWLPRHGAVLAGCSEVMVSLRFPETGHGLMRAAARAA